MSSCAAALACLDSWMHWGMSLGYESELNCADAVLLDWKRLQHLDNEGSVFVLPEGQPQIVLVQFCKYLLSGLRFSTAVWVWLVVRTETCSPSGPLAVEMTSYSEKGNLNVIEGARKKHCFSKVEIRVSTKEPQRLRLSVWPSSFTLFVPVVSLSVFSQSRMTKEGQPSTVTTVRLEGGDFGGAFTLGSLGSSSGK